MLKGVYRALLKFAAIAAMLFIGMPLLLLTAAGSFWIMNPLRFFAPFLTLLALGLILWAIVEVVRRLSPKSADTDGPTPRRGLGEADVRLVLASKEAIGQLRMLGERLEGTTPSSQLLGLAAVADGLLKSLADEPEILNSAGRLLDFHLPKIVVAAARLTALPEPAREEAAADRLSAAATQLSEVLRTCWDSPRRPDTTHLDQAVRALNVEFRKLGSAAA
jgi:hypothetical protein